MAQIDLVLGGARSGKSAFAEKKVLKTSLKPIYIATAEVFDTEMESRIKVHQQRRDGQWHTIECPIELSAALKTLNEEGNIILVDCLTLWLSNLMLNDYDIETYWCDLLSHLQNNQSHIVFVANEVGLSIVPENKLARQFRDFAGELNQRIASCADNVYFIAAGLPITLKGN